MRTPRRSNRPSHTETFSETENEATITVPVSGKSGGLNRSVQHLLAVYLLEFETPKFFLDADLGAAPPHRVLPENALTSLFVSGSTDAAGRLYFRLNRAATDSADHRSRLSLPCLP